MISKSIKNIHHYKYNSDYHFIHLHLHKNQWRSPWRSNIGQSILGCSSFLPDSSKLSIPYENTNIWWTMPFRPLNRIPILVNHSIPPINLSMIPLSWWIQIWSEMQHPIPIDAMHKRFSATYRHTLKENLSLISSFVCVFSLFITFYYIHNTNHSV